MSQPTSEDQARQAGEQAGNWLMETAVAAWDWTTGIWTVLGPEISAFAGGMFCGAAQAVGLDLPGNLCVTAAPAPVQRA